MEVKAVKSVQRALRKVEKTKTAFLAAKSDEETLDAYQTFEKAKASYGRAIKKANES